MHKPSESLSGPARLPIRLAILARVDAGIDLFVLEQEGISLALPFEPHCVPKIKDTLANEFHVCY